MMLNIKHPSQRRQLKTTPAPNKTPPAKKRAPVNRNTRVEAAPTATEEAKNASAEEGTGQRVPAQDPGDGTTDKQQDKKVIGDNDRDIKEAEELLKEELAVHGYGIS